MLLQAHTDTDRIRLLIHPRKDDDLPILLAKVHLPITAALHRKATDLARTPDQEPAPLNAQCRWVKHHLIANRFQIALAVLPLIAIMRLWIRTISSTPMVMILAQLGNTLIVGRLGSGRGLVALRQARKVTMALTKLMDLAANVKDQVC